MKQAMSQHGNMTYDYCLTPEQAKRPQGKFFNDKAANNCRYDHFTMGGGKIDAVMRCDGKPSSMTMTIDGTYGADSYATHVQMNMAGGPQGSMSMKMRSRRIASANARPRTRPRRNGNRERTADLAASLAVDNGCPGPPQPRRRRARRRPASSPTRSSRRSRPAGLDIEIELLSAAIARSARGRSPSAATSY